MTTVHLTRTARFCASHRYFRPEWTEEENQARFGQCANAPGHGHNYVCTVTVRGTPKPDTGMVLDLLMFDQILKDEIVQPFDHRHINDAVEEFALGKTIPTSEMLAVYLGNRVASRLPDGVQLERMRVEEAPGFFAEYFGDPDVS